MWRVLTLVAFLWPSRIAGVFDGVPLDTAVECILVGLVVPALLWFHPSFVKQIPVRVAIAAILLCKLGTTVAMQQEGWCVAFTPPYPMVRESTGKPHSWDMRADWLSSDPNCSAVMTRSYRDSFEVPAWFYNLPPPTMRWCVMGSIPAKFQYVSRSPVTSALVIPASLRCRRLRRCRSVLRIDGTQIEPREPGRHEHSLKAGVHSVQFEGTMLGKQWRVVPEWNSVPMGSMLFPLTTILPPSRAGRLIRTIGHWMIPAVVAGLILAWVISLGRHVATPSLLIWSGGAVVAIVALTIYLPERAAWHTAIAIAVTLSIPVRRRFRSSRGVFLLVLVPWLTYVAAANAYQIGRWTLYGIGNDNFLFQRFSYRIFMQHFWLEGGQQTFWNQPLFRLDRWCVAHDLRRLERRTGVLGCRRRFDHCGVRLSRRDASRRVYLGTARSDSSLGHGPAWTDA